MVRKMDEMIKNESVLRQDSARGIEENEGYCVKAMSLFYFKIFSEQCL